MDLGLVGLGKMGGNMARRLARGGHRVLGYARTRESVLALEKDGVGAAEPLPDLVARLQPPRAGWLMLPAGAPTEAARLGLGGLRTRGPWRPAGSTAAWFVPGSSTSPRRPWARTPASRGSSRGWPTRARDGGRSWRRSTRMSRFP